MFDHAEKELWVWTELLAFDNDLPDFGVKNYLNEMQRCPYGISFLTGYDFVMHHKPLEQENILPANACSRSGHLTNGRRNRQDWTNFQLRDLIAELHKYNIKVVFNIFPGLGKKLSGQEFLSYANPEKRSAVIAPMNDGRIMGDAMIEKLAETISDYDFDGWQAADDIASPWIGFTAPTDNLIRLFAENRPELPEFLKKNADQNNRERRRKLQYLQQFCWREWNAFLEDSWKRFWIKAVNMVHQLGKILLVNSPNTKSIFGALQYMNVDYRFLAQLGIDYLIVETCTASCGLVWHNRTLLHEFSAVASEMAASMPGVKILMMPAVRDRVEGFDMFEHALPRLERDLHILNSHGILRDGELQRCADGFMFCLGDCITPAEWERFHKMYAQSVSFDSVRNGELVWLLDPEAFDALREDHHLYGTWSPAAQITILKNLRSIDISTIAAIGELEDISQPLIVPNFHLLSKEHRTRILDRKIPLIITGNFQLDELPEGAESIYWQQGQQFIWHCAFLNFNDQLPGRRLEVKSETPASPLALAPFNEAEAFSLYRDWYPHLDMPENFWRTAADRIRELLGPLPIENEHEGVQVYHQYAADGTVRLFQISRKDHYVVSQCRITPADAEISVAGIWPTMPLCVENGMLSHGDVRDIPIRIPPHGIVATDIKRKQI